jgi:hypothetical protein
VFSGLGCEGCGAPATTVVIEFSAISAYLELCETHLSRVLWGARPLVTGREGAGDALAPAPIGPGSSP